MKKFPAAVVAVLSCSAVFLSSCVYEVPVYRGGAAYSYSSAAPVWTEASYDANGFPIFGYYGGRPVYGYTAEGVAVFTFAALTAACLVPLWAPAPWYHGHWHYPHHIHRVSAPVRFPHDHCPAMRPHGGLNAPIHKHPHQVLQAHHNVAPHHNAVPQARHHAPQMSHDKPLQHRNVAPQHQQTAPQHSVFSPAPGQKGPVINRREQSRPQVQQHHVNRSESAGSRRHQQSASPMMSAAAPSAPAVHAAPSMAAPSVSRPSAPSAGNFNRSGHSNASFSGGAGHNHHGGHGGHRR